MVTAFITSVGADVRSNQEGETECEQGGRMFGAQGVPWQREGGSVVGIERMGGRRIEWRGIE